MEKDEILEKVKKIEVDYGKPETIKWLAENKLWTAKEIAKRKWWKSLTFEEKVKFAIEKVGTKIKSWDSEIPVDMAVEIGAIAPIHIYGECEPKLSDKEFAKECLREALKELGKRLIELAKRKPPRFLVLKEAVEKLENWELCVHKGCGGKWSKGYGVFRCTKCGKIIKAKEEYVPKGYYIKERGGDRFRGLGGGYTSLSFDLEEIRENFEQVIFPETKAYKEWVEELQEVAEEYERTRKVLEEI